MRNRIAGIKSNISHLSMVKDFRVKNCTTHSAVCNCTCFLPFLIQCISPFLREIFYPYNIITIFITFFSFLIPLHYSFYHQFSNYRKKLLKKMREIEFFIPKCVRATWDNKTRHKPIFLD